jgi:phosphoglycolate phosphatase
MIKAILTDLDNTLYNWIDYYVPSFLAMVSELSTLTGIDQEKLKSSFKRVHERHKTTEYSFAIEQLDVLTQANKGLTTSEILLRYESAIRAFRRSRKSTLKLYDGVAENLLALKRRGKILVAVTDSLRYYAEYRLRQLGIDSLFDALVSPPDHGIPDGLDVGQLRYYQDASRYESVIPVKIAIPAQARKPDTAFIVSVLRHFNIPPPEAVYIGDSATKDILMAQMCGVHDVLAAYGHIYSANNYAELVKITYWTNADVEEDRKLRTQIVQPTWTVNDFAEIPGIVERLDAAETTDQSSPPHSHGTNSRP